MAEYILFLCALFYITCKAKQPYTLYGKMVGQSIEVRLISTIREQQSMQFQNMNSSAYFSYYKENENYT